MKSLDQGHLHPKLEVPRLNRIRASVVGGEHSSKELFGTYSYIHMCPRQLIFLKVHFKGIDQ